MTQRMVHYTGGPIDGYTELMAGGRHPMLVSLNTDTDGYYVMEYQVTGQRIGESNMELTNDDIVARWHQRSTPHDFMVGDTVIVRATGERAMVMAPTTCVNADGTTDEGWTIAVGSSTTFVAADEIRIASPEELSQDDA